METQDQLQQVDKYAATCPSCSASIKFNPSTGNLTCPYCGYEEHIPEAEKEEDRLAQEIKLEEATLRDNFDWGTDKKVVICEACAAESIYDALDVANVCPYCGSNHVMESGAENALAPNGVCPFQVTREQADEHFRKWLGGKWFAPSKAKKMARAEAFQGVYLPFWTFDSQTSSQYTAEYGIDSTTTDSEGNSHTTTTYYRTSGFHQEFIDDHLVCATDRYNVEMFKQIEPFDTNNSRAYSKEYLSGYVAERYSIGLEQGWNIAQKEIHDRLRDSISSKVRYENNADSVRGVNLSTVHDDITFKYVMLPIWLSSFQYRNKTYQFAVNGQNGNVGGKYPISPWRVALAIFIGTIIALLLFFGTGFLEG